MVDGMRETMQSGDFQNYKKDFLGKYYSVWWRNRAMTFLFSETQTTPAGSLFYSSAAIRQFPLRSFDGTMLAARGLILSTKSNTLRVLWKQKCHRSVSSALSTLHLTDFWGGDKLKKEQVLTFLSATFLVVFGGRVLPRLNPHNVGRYCLCDNLLSVNSGSKAIRHRRAWPWKGAHSRWPQPKCSFWIFYSFLHSQTNNRVRLAFFVVHILCADNFAAW